MNRLSLTILSSLVLCGAVFAQAARAAPKQQDCCADGKAKAKAAMATAQGQEDCCKSTAAHPIAKGEPGCCNAKGAPAKFKVYVSGIGYKYFGCEDSAANGRKALVERGAKVGSIQKVTSKAKIA